MKTFFYYLNLLLVFISCDEKKNEKNNQLILDTLITIDLKENEYKIFYVCEKNNLNLFKNDLKDFREHLDFNDTFCINIYSYKNLYIAEMPNKFDMGMASFLTSWLEYGFALSKNSINSNNDLIFYRDDNLMHQNFIPASSRDNKLTFKIDFIKSGFSGLKNNCYSYKVKDSTILSYKEFMPANFKISDWSLIESNFILPKATPIEPYIDTTKKLGNKSINI